MEVVKSYHFGLLEILGYTYKASGGSRVSEKQVENRSAFNGRNFSTDYLGTVSGQISGAFCRFAPKLATFNV